MTYIGNSPDDKVVIRLQARKSFALGLWIQDQNKNPLDIGGSTIRLVVRKPHIPSSVSDDSGNLISSSLATILSPTLGFARFEIQAAELDHEPGEYAFSIVLVDEGYSSTIVNGVFEIEQNTEFSSVTEAYSSGTAVSTALQVALRGQNTLSVRTGPTLAPGEVTFTAAMEARLLRIYAGAATQGMVLDADDIADGTDKVIMTAAERAKLADLVLEWDDIQNKPAFGTIIEKDLEDVVLAGQGKASDIVEGVMNAARLPIVFDHNGLDAGTGVPVGGSHGYLYFQYDE